MRNLITNIQSRSFSQFQKSLVVAIAGPTAVGKSSVAAELCRKWKGEIISVDSVQVYKELNIGSAKPTEAEQAAVKHHLIDLMDCKDTMSAGDFTRLAKTTIDSLLARDTVPVLTGGSTMWMDWISRGIPNAPKSRPHLETAVDRLVEPYETAGLWDEIIESITENIPQDSTYHHISRNNWVRLKRYMVIDFAVSADKSGDFFDNKFSEDFLSFKEVRGDFFTGHRSILLPASSENSDGLDNSYDSRQFFLYFDREILYRNIEKRCEEMISNGLITEVGNLLLNGVLCPEHAACKAIGYRQAIEYLCRENFITEDYPAFLHFLRNFGMVTRNYAQKQFQWYRKKRGFLWVDSNQSLENLVSEIEQWCAIPRKEYEMAIRLQATYVEDICNHRVGVERDVFGAQRLSLDHDKFNLNCPWLSNSFNIAAQFTTAKEKDLLKRHTHVIGFIPAPSSVKRSSGRSKLAAFTPDEEIFWCKESKEVKKHVAEADRISSLLMKTLPNSTVGAFRSGVCKRIY